MSFMKRFACVCFMRKRTEKFCIIWTSIRTQHDTQYRYNLLNKLGNIFDDVGDGVFDESFHRTEDDFFESRADYAAFRIVLVLVLVLVLRASSSPPLLSSPFLFVVVALFFSRPPSSFLLCSR